MIISEVVMKLFQATLITCLTINISNTLATITPNPNCPMNCGNVSIPFPFGIGPDCSINKWFEIVCKNVYGSQTPFLKQVTDLKVLKISIEESTLLTENPINFFNCSDKKSPIESNLLPPANLTLSPFSYSDSKNRLTSVGCDVFAYIDSIPDNKIFQAVGCTAECAANMNNISLSTDGDNSNNNSYGGGCYGRNCCQTIIPSYLESYEIEINRFNSNNKNCSYAFVVDNDWLSHVSLSVVRNMDYVPVTLDWDILEYLNEFKNMSSPLKPKYSHCYSEGAKSSITKDRLRCMCKEGYRGNPYLFMGCQDIDECVENPRPCLDDQVCENTIGSHSCKYKTVHKIRPILIGVSSGIGALLSAFSGLVLYKLIKRREDTKRRKKFFKLNGGLLLQQQTITSVKLEAINVDHKTKLFNSKELEKATDHYNANRVLGQGGQGTVYKGMLEDGKIVAVKKSKLGNKGQVTEFINEVFVLSQINHRNVVKLLGCCLETEVPLLVYEFIPNGTLYHYLHDPNEEFQLTWEMRLRIATEVSGALFYLHSAASVPIYHRDIKSTNILLDEKYRAKVADFGTSRSLSENQTHLTTLVSGTFGYMDPEYFRSNQFTEKSDVYSFGVVIVELLSGQKPVSRTSSRKGSMSVVTYFIECMEANNLLEIVDPAIIKEGCNFESLKGVANLAYRCLSLAGKNRPAMKEIAIELENVLKSHASTTLIGSSSCIPSLCVTRSLDAETISSFTT
ncbi:hypothetical protein CsatA_016390 [Cannabis sativa]